MIRQTVPNKPIKGAVDPTVAKKVKCFSIILISLSAQISITLLTLAAWIEEDLDLVLIN